MRAPYAGRMQIEQSFRDVKNPYWGLDLFESRPRKPQRLATLPLLGALASYAVWLIEGKGQSLDGMKQNPGCPQRRYTHPVMP